VLRAVRERSALVFTKSLPRGATEWQVKILCSGVFLTSEYVLSARHCLPSPSALKDVTLVVRRYAETYTESSPGLEPAGQNVSGILYKRGARFEREVGSNQYDFADDAVLLVVKPERGPEPQTWMPCEKAEYFRPLVLSGMNDLILRLHQLRLRLRDKKLISTHDLVGRNWWRTFVRTDQSPTCRAVQVLDGRIDHYCQSYGGISGSGLIGPVPDAPKNWLPRLIGLHLAGPSAFNGGASFDAGTLRYLNDFGPR
jgi:hypothetical protein